MKTTLTLTAGHLKVFRQHFGLTQDQAAELVGVSRVTWNRWENGATIPAKMALTLKGAIQELKEQQTKEELGL